MHRTDTLPKFIPAHVGGGAVPHVPKCRWTKVRVNFNLDTRLTLTLPLTSLVFKVGRIVRSSTLILQDDGIGDATVRRIPCAKKSFLTRGYYFTLADRWWCRGSTAPSTQGQKAAKGGARCTNWCPPRSSTTPKQTVGASPALCSPGTTDRWPLRAMATCMRGATSQTSWWSSTPPPKSGAKCSLRSTALSKLYDTFSSLPFPSTIPMLQLLRHKRRA